MKNITGLFSFALAGFLLAASNGNGVSQNNGYCIGNQCFAAFQDPTDFTTAQNNCAEKGGHLMTVRSSVSHDTLFIILGGRSGEYWIGLHLTSGCPDASTELRGFQWVTRDGESDFYNWGAFDGTCSPRCVSVSREGDFKWNQESCSKRAAGYLCEYNFQNPCKRLAVRADGESVTYRTPYGFEGEDVLSLPPGSTAVRQPAETKAICFGERWLDAPWSCEIDEGGCEHQCAASDDQPGINVCFCPAGQVVNPGNNVTCEVFKDDPCLSLRCEQACFQTNDTYACMCDHGFELAPDGRTCGDIDDCADERQCPGEHFACVNTVGAFHCVCESGYRPTGDGRCADVNECMSAPCEHECTNTPGSYKCSCFDGYTMIPEAPHKCKLFCGREECPAECDPNDHLQCYCPQGYVSDERPQPAGVFCIDINECDMGFCDQECQNTYGSYTCSCREGFGLVDGYMCKKDEVDIDTDGWEGSGATTPFAFVTPTVLYPEPTSRPSGVTAGGLLGIIVCIVVVILLLVFLAHHVLKRRGKLESGAGGALKTRGTGDECHDLEQVTTEKYEKPASDSETTLKQDS